MNNLNDNPITYFLYRRKSTDDERQVLSLESQEDEALKRFGNLKIIKLPPESVSAFKPYKRPVFKDMIERIQKGEAQGIIAWHPDRLSRNPIDAAQIIYLLDTGELKDLKFCSFGFENSPEGKMLLQITMSQSKYSSDKLSKDVKRGIDKKASSGWRPGLAPLGYTNSRTKLKGEQNISNDPERFHLVKQLWQMMLTGNYSVAELINIANNRLKLTQPATLRRPERKVHLSTLYRILTHPFYYGWYEWPEGSGNWVKGNHEPMITGEEYDQVQKLLGKEGRPRPKKHRFAFTGMMRCGNCGAMITAETKVKRQKNGNIHHYLYYRCTKRKDKNCPERAVELKNLNSQIDAILKGLTISEKFKNWAIKYLHEIRKEEARAQEESFVLKQRALKKITEQMDNLLLKYTSPENTEGILIADQEYQTLKSRLLKKKAALEDELKTQGRSIEEWVELSERTFNFARYARIWFAKGDTETKRAIFACLGSNLIIKDRKLALIMKKPFNFIFEGLPKAEQELIRLEPLEIGSNISNSKVFAQKFPILSGIVNDVRTCWQLNKEHFLIPNLP